MLRCSRTREDTSNKREKTLQWYGCRAVLKIYPSTVTTIDRSQRFGAEIMQSRPLFLDNQYTDSVILICFKLCHTSHPKERKITF